MRITKTAMTVVLTLPLVVALVGLAVLVLGPRLLPYQALDVRSASMQPGLPMGSLAVFVQADAENLHQGDVILFEQGSRMVTHRIVAVEDGPEGRKFRTQGDANNVADAEAVPATGQGWRLAGSVPEVGWLVGGLQTLVYDRTILLGLGSALALVFLIDLWWPRRDLEDRADVKTGRSVR